MRVVDVELLHVPWPHLERRQVRHAALLEFLADALGVRKSALTLLDGHTGRRKRVLCGGCDVAAVIAALS